MGAADNEIALEEGGRKRGRCIMKPQSLLGALALLAVAAVPSLAQEPVKLGFITKFPVPFFATMENAAKEYAKRNPGVEIIYGQGASATDIEGQIAQIESMVTRGVQGIALTPVDPTVSTALDKAVAAGIKVVLMDNNIPDWKGRTALATTDNFAAGKIAGEYLKTVLKAGDTMGILEGVPGVPALDDRVKGMLEGLNGLDVKIVGKGATNCSEELGISVAEDLLTKNPDLKAIYAACGPPAAGAARAIKNAGTANDKIVLVGFDFCCGEEEALKSGVEDASVAQFPTKMAELGVDALVKAIRGEKVESLIDSGAALVTPENMAKFQ
ncbi:sugar ABC transporter substrate-binding protein [Rhizobium anhuiense]|nr:sugar ABC transporter substrate-binding protein [Rhizobium anhuiense]